jgi:hypothetical protein
MGDYFVRPSTTTLQIFDGHTITVKTYLSHGERDESFGRMYVMNEHGKMVPVLGQLKLAMVTAYLVDWSVTDRAGARVEIFQQPVEAVEQKLRNLFPDEFAEIHAAIVEHEHKMQAARAQEKKRWASDDAVTSPSLSAVAGALTGSVS